MKHITEGVIATKRNQDPRTKFLGRCEREHVVALPALSKIRDKVLNLKGYQMNAGLCSALGQAFLLYNHVVEKLFMESTGTQDDSFARVLEGLAEQHGFKTLCYKKNDLGPRSVAAILALVRRPLPHNLDELRIVNCRVSASAIQTLLQGLPSTNLRKLTLVKTGLRGSLLDYVIELTAASRSLVELDISWNRITSAELRKLFAVLAGNRQLQYLNTSWNEVQEPQLKDVAHEQQQLRQKALLKERLVEGEQLLGSLKAVKVELSEEDKSNLLTL